MLPKRILEHMPRNTHSMILSNDRQLAIFITLFKTYAMCLYVSFTANKGRLNVNRNQQRVIRENASMDFSSFGNVQYETVKPSLETMKQSQMRKNEINKSGDIFSGKKELIMKLSDLSVIEKFNFSIKKSWKYVFYAKCFVPECS